MPVYLCGGGLPCELGRDRRGAGADEPAERSARQVALHQARYSIRLVLVQLGATGCDPADGFADHQQVAALLCEDGGRGRGPVADVERVHAGERFLGPVHCLQPRFRVPVRQVAVRAVEGEVTDERCVAVAQ